MVVVEKTIREVTDDTLDVSTEIIQRAFGTVAAEFGLTEKNCPTHPSFVTVGQLNQLKEKGLRFFGLFRGMNQVGFGEISTKEFEHLTFTVCFMELDI